MSHHDRVLTRFLERQREEGLALAAASDLLELVPVRTQPAPVYFAHFSCTGLVRRDGVVQEHDAFVVGIRFPDSYLRRFDTAQVLTWIEPWEVFHPNVRPPYICVGRMEPGTRLVDLLYQLFEVITYHNVEMREPEALNHDACVWARHNLYCFPVDDRPLRRRVRTLAPAGESAGRSALSPEG